MSDSERLDLPWWPGERRREREPLSREQIVVAAIRLIDRDGLEGLSMRRLGQELGVGATSLYWHVHSKEVLLALVSDVLYGEMLAEMPGEAKGPWAAAIAAQARVMRRVLVERHPRAVLLFAGQSTLGPNTLGVMEQLLGALATGGLAGQDLYQAYRAIVNYVYGAAAYEATALVERGQEGTDGRVGQLASLPAERFPNILSVAAVSSEMSREQQFEFGVQRLLEGIRAAAANG
jgi:TetR/AcrR family transcriptional regulator, tetracycline repressor protein